jgi:hypothetical protein
MGQVSEIKGANMQFLKRRISAAIWELLVLFVVVAALATAYRIYFSRAVALTQICDRIDTMQNGETADMFNQLTGDAADALKDINRICQIRRPIKE